MDLYEFQAKELFAAAGVKVPAGQVASTAAEAAALAPTLGAKVVVKAQVKTGGRGKAGGVKVVDAAEAKDAAEAILGMSIKNHVVHRVLVEQAGQISAEYYVSILLDRAARSYLAMCSVAGGMEIEQVAAETPELLARVPVDPLRGIDRAAARSIAEAGGLPAEALDGAADLIERLWQVFLDADATLVEVNPMVLTVDGDVMALDGKVSLDDNAEFRHADLFARFADPADLDPLEQRAREVDLHYVKLDGQVGIIGNGAGLVMSTLDVVADAGSALGIRPANFLDIGGGASADTMAAGLEIVLSDPAVTAVLVNVFGGITACDEVAKGIITAVGLLGDKVAGRTIVVRLDGNKSEVGRALLADAALPGLTLVETMDAAAERAAHAAAANR